MKRHRPLNGFFPVVVHWESEPVPRPPWRAGVAGVTRWTNPAVWSVPVRPLNLTHPPPNLTQPQPNDPAAWW